MAPGPWLDAHYPEFRGRVEQLIRATRDGGLYESQFGERMVGSGAYARAIGATFTAFAKRLGLDPSLPPLDTTRFRPPRPPSGQLRLF